MHLKQLKLAGFKSFVDPTIVEFPSHLVGIVGPNGCGKSNIIDAVRWVMGESSAKNLRGESMTDVIFNGSSSRKALGQASVELIFDNSLGRLTGQFASYGEIGVKRVVTRDGDSNYYLNGSRCRRRDIVDIFLGTGSGARGYSIIGQGSVSRLIEAKPEELKLFLEEAAGVSKYKERRRETLSRIEHTRENLARVADIRDELDKQLQRLDRQAKAAKRYQDLKIQEQACRADILALRWRDFIAQQDSKRSDLQQLAINYEQQQSQITSINKDKTLIKEQIYAVEEQAQNLQQQRYQIGTEMARLEESIGQQEKEQKRLQQDLQQIQQDIHNSQQRIEQDQAQYQQCQEQRHSTETQLQQSRQELIEHEMLLQEIQEQQQQQETTWQELLQDLNGNQKQLHAAQLNVQHNEQRQQDLAQRLEKITTEYASISIDQLLENKQHLQAQQTQLQASYAAHQAQLQHAQNQAHQLGMQVHDLEKHIHKQQDAYHKAHSEHAALLAAQKAATNSSSDNLWPDATKLVEVLQVESDWQRVCECILQDSLQALVIEDFDRLLPQWCQQANSGEHILSLQAKSKTQTLRPSLADAIKGELPAHLHHPQGIYTTATVDMALEFIHELQQHESVVTLDGFWLGKGWARCIKPQQQDALGLLARQQKIVALAAEVEPLQQQLIALRQQRDDCHAALEANSQQVQQIRQLAQASDEALKGINAQVVAIEQALIHAQSRIAAIDKEREEIQQQLQVLEQHQQPMRDSLEALKQQVSELEQLLQQSQMAKQLAADSLALKAKELERMRQALQQLQLAFDKESMRLEQLQTASVREQERLRELKLRLEQINAQSAQTIKPSEELKQQLHQLVEQHNHLESQLASAHDQLAQYRSQADKLDKSSMQQELQLKSINEQMAETKMQEQALAVRASSIQEALDELGLQASSVLADLLESLTQAQREDDLLAINKKITALGAINLAAIDEFSAEAERKQYLDAQYHDLMQALETLDSAIATMDKETLQRLETTFNELHANFKELFPRLFGGGRAHLEWTCDNLLEAGIVIMAQPPGKRNSTIHLLSGGEKAMTAVALVFAIFKLNPSPFCMLDEVDAPLDDVNVGRFCELVKEMSQFIQFLLITHNKVTMELTEHLIGVTMREPGVSRVVSVDVKQAETLE